MKLTAFLILISMLSVFAGKTYSQSKMLNLSMEHVSVREVLSEIEDQSDFYFMYSSKIIDVNRLVSIDVKDARIDEILNTLFGGTDVSYTIKDRYIVITTSEGTEATLIQQQKSVSGRVTDSSNAALPGVTVVVKGTTNGTITDFDGNYSISNVPSDGILVFSFVGMKTQEVSVSGKSSINVSLVEDAIGIEEVVAIGYGTTTKRKAVGAISTVNAEKLEQTPFNNMGEALQGQVPGLIVNNSGGKPGEIPSISIRGGETPLFVIDGVIKDEYSFSVLNPEDIESVSFLKDASATAVYGSRAGDGIILVTTKRGKDGDLKLRYSGTYQLSQPTVLPDLLNSYEFAMEHNDAARFDGIDPFFSDEQLNIIKNHTNLEEYPDNNWNDIVLNDFAGQHRHNISLTGGDKKTNYFVSLGYLDQGSILKGNSVNLNRYNVRSNINSSFEKIGLDVSLNISADLQKTRESSEGTFRIFRFTSYGTSPMQPYLNADGTFAAGFTHPAAFASKESGYIKERQKNIHTQVDVKWKVPGIDGLTAGIMGSYRDKDEFDKTWDVLAPQYYPDGTRYVTSAPALTVGAQYGQTIDFESRLAYNNTFGKHGIDAVMVYTQREGYYEKMEAFRKEYTSAAVDQIFAGPFDGQNTDGTAGENGSAGVVGRVKYDFASKYIIEFSGRYDGNDNFAPGQRWGFFPAISGAWVMIDEPFMQSLKDKNIISNLKLRAGWGETGITAGVNRFGYMPVYNLAQNVININNSLFNGYTEGKLVNPEALTWFSRKSTNVGFDFAMFNNSLEGIFDYFYYETSGYLMSPENRYTATIGKQLPQISSNSVHRRGGFEFSLRYKKRLNELYFEVGSNISYFDQLWEVKEDEDLASLKNPYVRETHQKDFFTSMYLSDGLYQSAEEVLNAPRPLTVQNVQMGDIRYVDANGDGKVDNEDQRRIGKPGTPHLNYGIDFRVKYRAWSLSGLIQGTGERMVDLGLAGSIPRDILRKNQLDYWDVDNTDARFPRISNGFDHGNTLKSDFWIENAAYVRLKNLQIRYDLKHRLLKNFDGISSCQLVLTGSNLLTFSDVYDYFDPEAWMTEIEKEYAGNVSGVEYPVQRTFSLGLNVEF